MELRLLEDFLSLAQSGSFSRSADERCITQPAFSRRIKSLENWVGTPLIDRSSYPTRLTPAGEIFRTCVEDVLRRLTQTRRDIAELNQGDGDTISIAVLHTLSLTFVPDWLRDMVARGMTTRCRFTSDNFHSCVEMLVEGGTDLLLCFTHASAPLPLDSGRFPSITLGGDKVVPVCVPDATGAPRHPLPGTAAHPCPVLDYSRDSYLGRAIDHMCQTRRVRPRLKRVYENSFTDALKATALAGHGTAWLPLRLVETEVAAGTLVYAGPETWHLDTDIRLFRSSDHSRPEVETFWQHAIAVADDSMPDRA